MRCRATPKEVRSQTAIGAESVSMAAAAVRLAERVFGNLDQARTLFIGAGQRAALGILRGGKPAELAVVVGTRPGKPR
ncbi:hypothetical protein BMR85_023920 [Achromobacter sp. KAs 3-5]|nr:hypothetical protein BMR85_023920 [Achromobacter sp. KAs 3-5]